jgi:hypothetical protein
VISADIFSTVAYFISWLIYICIFLSAFAKKSVLLIFAYLFVVLGFILEPPIVNKFGYKSLHVVAILSLILAVILLSKYLTNKIDYYKSNTIAKGDNNTEAMSNNTTIQHELSAAELADKLNKETELNISQLTFKAILNSSAVLEKFSTWLLAGIGVICALIITNINSISKIIDPSILKYSLIILVVSGVFGLLCKYYFIQIQIVLELDDILRKKLPEIMTFHIEKEKQIHAKAQEQGILVNTVPDILGAMRKALDSVPWFKRKSAQKGFEKGALDPLFGYRRGQRFLYYQSAVTVLEFICFLSFIFIIAVNL